MMEVLQKIFAQMEVRLAQAQGRGYGTSSCAAEVRALRRLAGPAEGAILDAGANVGEWTTAALQHFPRASYHLFEPSSVNVPQLRTRFAGHAGVKIVDQALSSAEGTATLCADRPGSGMASLHARRLEHHGLKHQPVEEVRCTTIDAYCAREGINAIDILKLDVEGHEFSVLQGAATLLPRTRAVQFEFGGCNIDSRTYFRDFWDLFATCGFRLHRITPFGPVPLAGYSERDEHFSTTNFIAVR